LRGDGPGPIKVEPGFTLDTLADGSCLTFMVEELISQGATFLAVHSTSIYSGQVEKLPKQYRRRIKVVDKSNDARLYADAILAPIRQEVGYSETENIFDHDEWDFITLNLITGIDLRTFVTGIICGVQIDIDVTFLRICVSTLRGRLTSPDAKAHLAMLSNILSVYKRHEVREMDLVPASPLQRAEAFFRFMEDARYKQLSKQRHVSRAE
jgi:hypothetical protein